MSYYILLLSEDFVCLFNFCHCKSVPAPCFLLPFVGEYISFYIYTSHLAGYWKLFFCSPEGEAVVQVLVYPLPTNCGLFSQDFPYFLGLILLGTQACTRSQQESGDREVWVQYSVHWGVPWTRREISGGVTPRGTQVDFLLSTALQHHLKFSSASFPISPSLQLQSSHLSILGAAGENWNNFFL